MVNEHLDQAGGGLSADDLSFFQSIHSFTPDIDFMSHGFSFDLDKFDKKAELAKVGTDYDYVIYSTRHYNFETHQNLTKAFGKPVIVMDLATGNGTIRCRPYMFGATLSTDDSPCMFRSFIDSSVGLKSWHTF